jgi:hypothetical protein
MTVWRENPIPKDPVIFIDGTPMTIYEVDLRVGLEKVRDKMEAAWRQQIVTVQIGHYLPRAPCEPLRDCVSLSVIRFRS